MLGIVDKMKHVLFIILGFPLLILSTHVANSKEEKVEALPQTFSVDGLKMIRVNPGIFKMGAPNMPVQAEPYEGVRQVKITKPFFLGETEVSQAMWERHMKINPSI